MIPVWPKVKLKTLYLGLYDGPHATPKESDTGAIFLGIKNVTEDGRLDLTEIRHIAEEDLGKWTKRVTPKKDDIVFSYEATLHRYARIPNEFRGCLGRRMALIRADKKKVNIDFLFSYFLSPLWRAEVERHILSGATVDRIPLTNVPDFELFLPPLEAQNKIAAILSAYDELIENNLERIKLLEEMAQITYEEWFVRMKFPGHEEIEIDSNTGLPQEWKEQDLNTSISIKHGYAYKGEFFCADQTNRVLLTPGNFRIGGGIKLDKVKYYDESAESPRDYLLKQHDLLVTMTDLSKKADTLGFPLLVPSSDTRTYLHNQRLGKVLPVGGLGFPKYFYYMLFKDEGYRAFVVGSATGATVKHSSPSKILAYKPKLPPLDGELIFKFNDLIGPIFETIDLLMKESELLKEARDILLPRLMTGIIDIEKVELPEALLERINKQNNNETNIG
ncbi:restriction endonuclease subunit S [Vibrio fluvialis]|nr:restriction endonuclease subunit S [Vibrio fluvialis]